MPFTPQSLIPPPLDPPAPPQGITNSTPVNVGIGGGALVGTNTFTMEKYGTDVAGIAFLVNCAFQVIKHWRWLDQHRWWPIVLVLLAMGFFWLGTHDFWQTLQKSGPTAVQAAINYGSLKATGLGIFEPAADPTP